VITWAGVSETVFSEAVSREDGGSETEITEIVEATGQLYNGETMSGSRDKLLADVQAIRRR
jgi:hypothetical protein